MINYFMPHLSCDNCKNVLTIIITCVSLMWGGGTKSSALILSIKLLNFWSKKQKQNSITTVMYNSIKVKTESCYYCANEVSRLQLQAVCGSLQWLFLRVLQHGRFWMPCHCVHVPSGYYMMTFCLDSHLRALGID